MTYYLAYFEINQDKDFYVELYRDLNYDYALFETAEAAVAAIKKHLKLAIDTFSSTKNKDYVKDYMEELYTDSTIWELHENHPDILHIDESLGNYDINYWICKVELIKEEEI